MTTRFVLSEQPGVVNLVARAVSPDGQTVVAQKTIIVTANSGTTPLCYATILPLGSVQSDLNSACAQMGIVNAYYLGDPNNTIYATNDCAVRAANGYYKTDGGGWIYVSNGLITQRGSCTTNNRTPENTATSPVNLQVNVPTPTLPLDRINIPTTSFTPVSPTTSPPIVSTRPITTTTDIIPTRTPPQPEPLIPLVVYGCTDASAANYNPEATQNDGSCIYSSRSAL